MDQRKKEKKKGKTAGPKTIRQKGGQMSGTKTKPKKYLNLNLILNLNLDSYQTMKLN